MTVYGFILKKLVKVLTCQWCMNVFADPVVMDCGHSFCFTCATAIQSKDTNARRRCRCPVCSAKLKPGRYIFNNQLGKAALITNEVKAVMAEESSTTSDSDSDSGVGSEDEQSEASSGSDDALVSMALLPDAAPNKQTPSSTFLQSPWSVALSDSAASPTSIASMQPPPYMEPDKDSKNNLNRPTLSPCCVPPPWSVTSSSVGSPCSVAPPWSVTSSSSVTPPCSLSSPEPPPSKTPWAKLEASSFPDECDQRRGSESRQSHLSSNSPMANRRHRSHPYTVWRYRMQTFSDILQYLLEPSVDEVFLNDVIAVCEKELNNSASVQTPEYPDPEVSTFHLRNEEHQPP